MPYFLESLDSSQRYSLFGPEEVYLVGRSEECDIRLDSRKVSRRHCCLAQVNDYLAVRDLASTNGIRINGREVFEGRLYHGDILTIGPYQLRVVWQPDNVAKAQSSRSSVTPAAASPKATSTPARPVTPAPVGNVPANSSPVVNRPPDTRAKPASLLEDSRLFKMLESDDPLLGGSR